MHLYTKEEIFRWSKCNHWKTSHDSDIVQPQFKFSWNLIFLLWWSEGYEFKSLWIEMWQNFHETVDYACLLVLCFQIASDENKAFKAIEHAVLSVPYPGDLKHFVTLTLMLIFPSVRAAYLCFIFQVIQWLWLLQHCHTSFLIVINSISIMEARRLRPAARLWLGLCLRSPFSSQESR